MFASRLRLLRPIFIAQKAIFHSKPVGLFNFPKMAVHSRGYNVFTGDISEQQMMDMSQYIIYSTNCYDIAHVFNKYSEDLTASHIAHAFNIIGNVQYYHI